MGANDFPWFERGIVRVRRMSPQDSFPNPSKISLSLDEILARRPGSRCTLHASRSWRTSN